MIGRSAVAANKNENPLQLEHAPAIGRITSPSPDTSAELNGAKYAMSVFPSLARILPVLLAAITAISFAPAANAQWGGDAEWGGGRQTVSFPTSYSPGKIIVSFGDRRLYKVISRGQAISYPIAVPREDARWQGTTNVSMKRVNPDWRPTPTMLRKNPRLPTWVPGGHPMNPLGIRALYLGASAYRIHGTDAPWTIGTAASSGCIRMYNEDVVDLYNRTNVGTGVLVTWKRYSGGGYASASSKKKTSYQW